MQASTYLHAMCPTDETILDAALAVLAREGYGGATTKKIAGEAGINEVTVFRKFKMSFICKLNGHDPAVGSDQTLDEFMGIFMNGIRAIEKQ